MTYHDDPRIRLVYVAGPMRGYERYNFAAFDAASAKLRALGYRVISPAEMDIAHGFDPDTDEVTPELAREFVRRDVDALCKVDAVVLLPGWENSTGARAECTVAEWLGIPSMTLAEVCGE